ncbi:MAG: transglycosylase domain-containing protein [Myxococcales bacterium]|nr:transglycosylase domain-containing protein [Myxococcales bacterium]
MPTRLGPTHPTALLLGAFVVASSCDTPGCGQTPEEVERARVEALVHTADTEIVYRDGTTRLGAVFEEEHRLAVGFDQLPVAWIMAIVAAEDGRFWRHSGVDPQGVARAAQQNVAAGTVVSGGSTLTQQTAKNLFERPDRSLGAKWEELDYALHIEKVFTKHEILTLYANLFHVTGNGSGIGVAARYFFDKEASELSLLESAYLAGLVKGPANYDPFIGDADRRKRVMERAVERTRYVLSRIAEEPESNLLPTVEDGFRTITAEDVASIRKRAKRLMERENLELPFKRGRFRYPASILVDEVERRLATEPFQQVLAEAGVVDVNKAGLTIVTTLDDTTQRESTYGLWHHLSALGTMLEGIGADAFVKSGAKAPKPDPTRPPELHTFRDAAVTAHADGGLVTDLGGFTCTVDRDAIVRASAAVYRGEKKDRWAKVPTATVDAFVQGIADGSVVWVSIRDMDADGNAFCDLEVRPELQGAVVVVHEGELRAMVGGSTNRDFDRVRAPRQFGSTFKPLVYHAAMTLGWRPDDVLDNRRNTFLFSGTTYSPRPDHEPLPDVSLSWAGVKSENLASIWLLYHLADHLDPYGLSGLAKTTGLSKEPEESLDEYKTRIQKAGILPTKGRLPESHFAAARAEISASLMASGEVEEGRKLRSIQMGTAKSGRDTWRYLEKRVEPCKDAYKELKRALRKDESLNIREMALKIDDDGGVQVACGVHPADFKSPVMALRDLASGGRSSSGGRTVSRGKPAPEPAPRRTGKRKGKGKSKAKAQTAAEPEAKISLPPMDEMLVESQVSLGTLQAVVDAIERQALVFEEGELGLYSPEVLHGHQDYRVLMAMRYVTHIAEQYGVQTELKEVLSLPLGATEITLEEAAVLYSGLVSGQAFPPAAGPEVGPTTLIAEIRDRTGKVIYQAETTPVRVADPEVGEMTADVLRNVVQHGTGRSVKGTVKQDGKIVPIGGKTGTTNDFRNAAFMGYLPQATPTGFSAADGHVVGAYVGYDDNRSMSEGRIKVSGAVGALPPWIAAVKGAHVTVDAASPSVSADGDEWPLARSSELIERVVDTKNGGLPFDEGDNVSSDAAVVLTAPDRRVPVVTMPKAPPDAAGARKGRKAKSSKAKGRRWWQFWQ